jgi:transposase
LIFNRDIPIRRLSHLLQHAAGRSTRHFTTNERNYMSKARKLATAKTNGQLPAIHPHAGGIDIGATQIQVAVPNDADPKPVRTFTTFTDDLLKLHDWLKACGVKTVAMESTGVYWIPLHQILEAAGIEVCLVNARHCKNLPGRKTDVSDCQWLQYLHSVGLLRASFRPPEHICAVRSLLRQRANLVRYASTQVMQMQKALTQMNVQIHNVISDLAGVTAWRSWTPSCVANGTAKSWRHYQNLMAERDAEIERVLATLASKVNVAENPPPPSTLKHKKPARNEPQFDARTELYRLCGVELTQVPGIQVNTALVLFGEVGPDFVRRFPTAKCFASWLGLCPDNRITGGKIISVKTRDVKSRAAEALRLGAQALWQSKTYLGDCFRRWKARLGTPKAITAMAHKLARIIWHLIQYQEPYDPAVWAKAEEKNRQKKLKRLQQNAATFGYQLVSLP